MYHLTPNRGFDDLSRTIERYGERCALIGFVVGSLFTLCVSLFVLNL